MILWVKALLDTKQISVSAIKLSLLTLFVYCIANTMFFGQLSLFSYQLLLCIMFFKRNSDGCSSKLIFKHIAYCHRGSWSRRLILLSILFNFKQEVVYARTKGGLYIGSKQIIFHWLSFRIINHTSFLTLNYDLHLPRYLKVVVSEHIVSYPIFREYCIHNIKCKSRSCHYSPPFVTHFRLPNSLLWRFLSSQNFVQLTIRSEFYFLFLNWKTSDYSLNHNLY